MAEVIYMISETSNTEQEKGMDEVKKAFYMDADNFV